MKLTNTQQSVMDRAKADIDYARTHDFRSYIARCKRLDLEKDSDRIDEIIAKDEDENSTLPHWWANSYEEEKNGVVVCIADSRTLKALSRIGLIEIIEDGGSWVDTIRVLNY